jgi:hypothetical protein
MSAALSTPVVELYPHTGFARLGVRRMVDTTGALLLSPSILRRCLQSCKDECPDIEFFKNKGMPVSAVASRILFLKSFLIWTGVKPNRNKLRHLPRVQAETLDVKHRRRHLEFSFLRYTYSVLFSGVVFVFKSPTGAPYGTYKTSIFA